MKLCFINSGLWVFQESFLSGRFQRIILDGQTSSRKPGLAGIPHGSILGLPLHLVDINDLPNELKPSV